MLIIKWLIYTLAIGITGYLLPGVTIDGLTAALIAALILGLINAILKPLLVFLTLPITFLTFGLFLLVINALLILLAGEIVPGFNIDGFWWALLFSIIVSFLNSIFNQMVKENQA